MGKVKFTAAIAEIRNKLGGSVYARNRYGNYARDYVIPINPNTTYQQGVRANWTECSNTWKTITEAQREQWRQASNDLVRTDIYGNGSKLSGLQYYMKINMEKKTLSLPKITVPPVLTKIPLWGNVTLTWAGGINPLSVDIMDTNLSSAYSAVIRATPALSQGVVFFKTKYSIIKVLANASLFPNNISAAYTAKFGAFVSGKRVAVEIYIVVRASGQRSQSVHAYIDIP